MENKNAIGLFDSGVGGTTIWREIIDLLPNEHTLLLADSKNAPYGEKSKDEIIALCEKNTEFLLNKEVKIIVVACNTATTNAIGHLRQKYKNTPFIGIEPAIKPASLQSKTKKIGVLATKGTLSSELFLKNSDDLIKNNQITMIERVGEGLIELIEAGKIQSEAMFSLLKLYLEPMMHENIDYLVLGCTHYPYLLPQIQKILAENIKIIDAGGAVAKQTNAILEKFNLLNKSTEKPHHTWLTNGNLSVLEQFMPENQSITVSFQDF